MRVEFVRRKNKIKNRISIKILGLVKNICWINNSFLNNNLSKNIMQKNSFQKNILPKTARQNKNIINIAKSEKNLGAGIFA